MAQLEVLSPHAQTVRSGSSGRLIIVSNRVSVPTAGGAPAAGGLAVALEEALKTRGGIWFGWSGKTGTENDPQLQLHTRGAITYAVMDLSRRDVDEYYHGFSNRVLMAGMSLPPRSRGNFAA